MGRSTGPDKNRDAEGMLTREGVAANKAAKQLGKATTAASQHKGISGGTYLDQYNKLKDTKNKTKNQLSSLASMNEQMGYNPTTGMGIMGSLNYNTIGAGADIANLMNNPLVKMAGMATNPLGFAGSMLGKNLYQNFTDEDKNTGFLNAASKTAKDVTPFDTNRITDFLGNLFRQEEEEADYVGSDVVNTIDPTKTIKTSPFMEAYNEDMNAESPYGGTPSDFNLLDGVNFLEDYLKEATTPLTDIELNSNPLLNSKITPDNIDQYQDNVEQEKLGVDMFQTGGEGSPYQQFFNDSYSRPQGLLFNQRPGSETNDNNFIDPNINSNMPVIDGTNNLGVLEASTGFGTINPRANYNKLYGFTAANGGRVPPMSGPMSNGLGNLFKMK
jgi:hypothetical protein